jgi:hypothetical protein
MACLVIVSAVLPLQGIWKHLSEYLFSLHDAID